MTREETVKIIKVIKDTFPNWKPDDLSATVDTWHFMLSDYDYNVIAIALKTYVTTSGSSFAPAIPELIEIAHKGNEYNQLSENDAWNMVSNALRNSAYHAQEEFDKLPVLVQKAVGSASQLYHWGQTDLKTIETVIASNFQRAYRTIASRELEFNRLPVEARALIAEKSEMLRLE